MRKEVLAEMEHQLEFLRRFHYDSLHGLSQWRDNDDAKRVCKRLLDLIDALDEFAFEQAECEGK